MTNRSCHHGRRRGERGVLAPLYFEIPQQKKVVFLISSGKNQIYLLLAPLDKFKKNPLMPPLEKILPTPMVVTTHFSPLCINRLVEEQVLMQNVVDQRATEKS